MSVWDSSVLGDAHVKTKGDRVGTHTHREEEVGPPLSLLGGVSRSSSPVVSVGGVSCGKCGNVHVGVCTYNKRCYTCGGLHAMKVCPVRKDGRRNSVV